MDKGAQAQNSLQTHSSISSEKIPRVPLRAADAKRSVKNIMQWNAYLPTDCVRTMVRMGWDYST